MELQWLNSFSYMADLLLHTLSLFFIPRNCLHLQSLIEQNIIIRPQQTLHSLKLKGSLYVCHFVKNRVKKTDNKSHSNLAEWHIFLQKGNKMEFIWRRLTGNLWKHPGSPPTRLKTDWWWICYFLTFWLKHKTPANDLYQTIMLLWLISSCVENVQVFHLPTLFCVILYLPLRKIT